MYTKGIYLDEPYTNALIILGFNEGLIRAYSGGKSGSEKEFLAKFTNPLYAKTALNNLVLYKKVYLYPYLDNFDIDEFVREDVFSLPNLETLNRPAIKFTANDLIKSGLLFPAISYLRYKNPNISEERLMEIVKSGILDQKDELWLKMMWYKVQKTMGIIPTETSSEYLGFEPGNIESEKELDKEIKIIAPILDEITPIFNALKKVLTLVSVSQSLETPALWEPPNLPSSKVVTSIKDDDLYVAAITFKELKRIKVDSLSDAIGLRENKNVEDFRLEVFDMIEDVKKGNLNEDQIKIKIRKANRILDLCKLAGPVGSTITVAGILGFLFSPLGAVLTITGASLVGAEMIAKKRYKWALISNK